MDVDYPYPSRAKSFLYLAFGIKNRKGKDYLKNARVIAKMVNESPKQVKAYWFFTPYTIPDKRLLDLLNTDKHEVALHVANKPFEEWGQIFADDVVASAIIDRLLHHCHPFFINGKSYRMKNLLKN